MKNFILKLFKWLLPLFAAIMIIGAGPVHATPAIPVVISPDSYSAGTSITFQWQLVSGATSYFLQVQDPYAPNSGDTILNYLEIPEIPGTPYLIISVLKLVRVCNLN